jgi:hypothetical protein
MKNFILQLYNAVFARALYVIADSGDSSITLSKRLCRHMGVFRLKDNANVFVFYIPQHAAPSLQPTKTHHGHPRNGSYGFTVNPDFEQVTQLAEIQYNSKWRTVGFETLNPTVARIFYDFRIPHGCQRVRLSVKVCRTAEGMTYYEILRPPFEQPKPKDNGKPAPQK